MQVIAGTMRGRKLKTPAGEETRPTSGLVRGAMFNILGPRIIGARVLDLYSGSGAIAIEAVSRGAEHVTLIERAPAALAVITQNLKALGLEAKCELRRGEVLAQLARLEGEFAGAIADPPYRSVDWSELLAALQLRANPRWVLIEHARGETLPERIQEMVLARQYGYGESHLALYQRAASI